jgi:hypothetical protein
MGSWEDGEEFIVKVGLEKSLGIWSKKIEMQNLL